eukprot:196424-Hanusia_phi.AAC.2
MPCGRKGSELVDPGQDGEPEQLELGRRVGGKGCTATGSASVGSACPRSEVQHEDLDPGRGAGFRLGRNPCSLVMAETFGEDTDVEEAAGAGV